MQKAHKRKTRAQRKAFIAAVVSSCLTVGFLIGTIISAVNIPKRHDLDEMYESNFLETALKGANDSYYIIASHKNESNITDDCFLYHYRYDNQLLEKKYVFNDLEDKFGVTGLTAINGMVTSYESDSLFIFSDKYLIRYTGLSDNELTLDSYSNQFPGRIVGVACDNSDIFVISQDARQFRIDRFSTSDSTYTPINSGYVYEVASSTSTIHSLICSKTVRIFTANVTGNYLYIYTGNYIRRYSKDLSGCNFRIIYENEYKALKESDPTLTDDAINSIIVANHDWESYNADTHDIVLKKSQLTADKFAFYVHPDSMAGTVRYGNKLYFVDKKRGFYRYSVDDLNETSLVYTPLEELLEYDEKVVFPYAITSIPDLNALSYDETGTTAMVHYEEQTPMMSILDLETGTIKATVNVSTRVGHAFYLETTDTVFYKYQDPVNKKSGFNYLSSFVVKYETSARVVQVLYIVFLIVAIASFISTTLSWLSYIFKPVMTKILEIIKGLRKNWVIFVILFPSIFILCLFCYYPGIAAIFTSFYDYKAGVSNIKTWNNFANYIQIFGNAKTLGQFGNMVLFLAADIVLAIIPPLIFAFFLTLMRKKKLSGIIRTLLFIPGIIPGIAGLLIWRTGIYGDYGLVNSVIKASGGTPILFFQQHDYTNMLWLILMGFPFVGSYLIFYGAMMNIPSSYYEAAEIDGISVFKRFVKIDIPLCFPQIKYVVIMTIIGSIQNFSRVYIAMNGSPGVVSTPIVEMYMLMNASERNYGLASAYASILFIILFFLTYLSLKNRVKEK